MMRLLKEKVPKEGVSPSMALLVIAVAGTAILSLGATTGQQVFAQADAPPEDNEDPGFSENHGTPRTDPGAPVLDGADTSGEVDPNCWGDVTVQLAQQPGQPGLGKDHASQFNEPRDGVGNQLEDTPAEHGDKVGDMVGINCVIE
jgi:hypothetical protein